MLDLKYILTEDPDDLWHNTLNYVTFMIVNGRVIYSRVHGSNHPDMTSNLEFRIENGEWLEGLLDDKIEFYPAFESAQEEDVWLDGLADHFAALGYMDMEEILSTTKVRSMYDLVGRLLLKGSHVRSVYNICSTWNSAAQIRRQLPLLTQFFSYLNLNIRIYKFQVNETYANVPYEILIRADLDDKPTRSKKEIAALLAKQHLDPNAKKQLGTLKGSEKLAQQAGAAGFNSPIAFKQFANQESVMVKEDPDELYYGPAKPIVFWLINDHWVFARGVVSHGDLARAMWNILKFGNYRETHETGGGPPEQFKLEIFPAADEKWWEELKGVLSIEKDQETAMWAMIDSQETLRTMLPIAGRLGTAPKENLCAFWNDTERVRDYLPQIKALFDHLGLDVYSYKFDPVDVDWNEEDDRMESLTWDDLKSDREIKPTRSEDDILALMKKQHLDPNAKRALGKELAGSTKYSQRALSAGFPDVARFKNYATTSESVITEDPDSIYFGTMSQNQVTFSIQNGHAIYILNEPDDEGFVHCNIQDVLNYMQQYFHWVPKGKTLQNSSEAYIKVFMNAEKEAKKLENMGIGWDKENPLTWESEARWAKMVRFQPYITTCAELYDYLMSLPDDVWEPGNGRHAFEVAGRMTINTINPTISFWLYYNEIKPHVQLVLEMIQSLGQDPTKYGYEFVDQRKNIDYNTLISDANLKPQRSKEEVAELMKKQHIDPSAKAAMGKVLAGSMKNAWTAMKAGFPTVANFKQFATQESVMIKETPDDLWRCYIDDDYGKILTFGVLKDRVIYSHNTHTKNMNHTRLKDTLTHVRELLKYEGYKLGVLNESTPWKETISKMYKWHEETMRDVGWEEEVRWEYGIDILLIDFFPKIQTIKELNDYLADIYQPLLAAQARYAFDVAGRLSINLPASDKHVIAFWNDTVTTIKYMPLLFKFMESINADPKKYLYDFIDNKRPVTFDSLGLTTGTRSKEEISVLMKKQHIDPKAKAKLGKGSAGSIKQGQIAYNAGFPSFAQFRQLTTQESVGNSEGFNYKNYDGWLDPSGEFHTIGMGELHHHWAYNYLVAKRKFKKIPKEWERDEEYVREHWDEAAGILYRKGWLRIVRFPGNEKKMNGSIHFQGDNSPNERQAKELRNLAMEEQRIVIDDNKDKVYYDPRNTVNVTGMSSKTKAWMTVKPEKPKNMSMAQFNFMRYAEDMTDASCFGTPSTPYADGDARVPTFLGLQRRPGFKGKKKKRKKKKVPYGMPVRLEAVNPNLPPIEEDPMPGRRYYYHLTRHASIPSIRANGLVANRNVISVAPHLTAVHWYADAIGDPTTLLRMKRQDVEADHVDDYYENTDTAELWLRTRIVSPTKLEVYENGVWRPLTVTHESFKGFTESRIVGIGLVDEEGNILVKGNIGDSHGRMAERAVEATKDWEVKEKIKNAYYDDYCHVFIDDEGNPLDREKAAIVATNAGQVKHPVDMLFSHDLVSEAVDNLPTEDEIYAAGETQRGEPEGKMLEACRRIQKIGAPPILVMALEHIGDLAHRASRTNALINVKEKVDRFLPFFSPRYQRWDWWKEIEQGFEDGTTYRVLEADPKLKAEWDLKHEDPKRRKNWEIWQEAQAKPERKALIRKAKDLTYAEMKEYAESHIKYNKPITTLGRLGKDAAIALGFCEYDKLKNLLQQMDFWMEKYEKASPKERDIMFRS